MYRRIAYFKYQAAKAINALRQTPGLPVRQRNYYEHIIRNPESLDRVREYISTNPVHWVFDRLLWPQNTQLYTVRHRV